MSLLLVIVPVLVLIWPGRYFLGAVLRRPPAPVPCTDCGITDGTRNVFGRCAACQERAERAEQLERTIRRRAYDAETARWRAEREAERIAARFPLVTVGSVYRNERGEPVFEGFEFNDPTGRFPAGPNQVSGRASRGALIAGWTQDELHHLAHGAACRCLDS